MRTNGKKANSKKKKRSQLSPAAAGGATTAPESLGESGMADPRRKLRITDEQVTRQMQKKDSYVNLAQEKAKNICGVNGIAIFESVSSASKAGLDASMPTQIMYPMWKDILRLEHDARKLSEILFTKDLPRKYYCQSKASACFSKRESAFHHREIFHHRGHVMLAFNNRKVRAQTQRIDTQ